MRTMISENDTENRLLFAATDSIFIHHPTHDLTVDDDKPSIVGREIGGRFLDAWVSYHLSLLVPSVTFRLDVDKDLRLFVGSHQNVEDLFSGPQSDRFPYCRRRNIDMEVGICKVTADLRELAAVKELVFLGKQE
jgi:hypothetical protein